MRRELRTGFVFYAALVGSAHLEAASFDCSKATSQVEKNVCASTRLSKLDEELAAVYGQARKLVADPAALKKKQQEWMDKERAEAARYPSQIEAAYLARIEEIRLLPEAKRPLFALQEPPASIFGRYSETEPLCLVVEGGETDCDHNGEVESYIDVRPGPEHAVAVKSTIVFMNGHECSIDGEAEWVSGELRVPALEDSRCVLLVRFEGDKAVPNDPGNLCKEALCGARGGYGTIALPKLATTPPATKR